MSTVIVDSTKMYHNVCFIPSIVGLAFNRCLLPVCEELRPHLRHANRQRHRQEKKAEAERQKLLSCPLVPAIIFSSFPEDIHVHIHFLL